MGTSSFEAVMNAYPLAPGSEWMVTDVQGETILMGTEAVRTPALIEVPRVNQMGEPFIVPYLLEEDITQEFEDTGTWSLYRFRPPFKWLRLQDDGSFLVGIAEERLGFWPEIAEPLLGGVPTEEETLKVPVHSRAKHSVRPVPIRVNDALETTIGQREATWIVWEPAWESEPRQDRPTPRRKA